MNIAIVSFFHNAQSYLERYFDQMAALQEQLDLRGDDLKLVLGYGDCTDNTEMMIRKETIEDFDVTLVDVSHGGKVYGSIVNAERFMQLSRIVNKLWSNLSEEADVVGFVESDLTWKPESILKLIDGSVSLEDALSSPILLAPMVMASEGRFYDTWAFRSSGRQFRQRFPYHRDMRQSVDFLEMDSVGSCVFMAGDLARQLRWPEQDVVVGLCREAKSLGAKVFLDTKTEVFHP